MNDDWQTSWHRRRLHSPTNGPEATVLLADEDGTELIGWRVGSAVVDGVERRLGQPRVEAGPDEIGWHWDLGEVQLSLRHDVDLTWQLRLSVTAGEHGCRIDRLELIPEPAAARTAWVVRAGAEGSLTLLGEPPDRPQLTWTLTHGEVRGTGPVLDHGGFTLAAGQRHLIRWRGELSDDLAAVADRHRALPEWPWVAADGEAVLEHPDQALAVDHADDEVAVLDDDAGTRVSGAAGRSARLSLTGPRGRTDVAVAFTGTVEETRRWWCEQHRWAADRQGLRIDDAAGALVVQSVLAGGVGAAGSSVLLEAWSDAVDGCCARWAADVEDGTDLTEPVFVAVLLALQAVRTGDPGHARVAAALLPTLDRRPGAGLAAVRVLATAGLFGVPAPPTTGRPPPRSFEASVLDGKSDPPTLLDWGAGLGFGLRGVALVEPGPAARAHRVAVGALGVEVQPRAPRRWPFAPAEIVERHRRRVLGEIVADPDHPQSATALAWLSCLG